MGGNLPSARAARRPAHENTSAPADEASFVTTGALAFGPYTYGVAVAIAGGNAFHAVVRFAVLQRMMLWYGWRRPINGGR